MSSTVLHVLFDSRRGGCETNALTLMQGLPNVRHEAAVFGANGPMCEAWRKAGANVTLLSRGQHSVFRVASNTRKLHKALQPTSVICWHGMVKLPQVLRGLRRHQGPVVVHGGNPAHNMKQSLDLQYQLMSVVLSPSQSNVVYACCSHFVADSFQESGYLRRFPKTVIYNGVQPCSVIAHQCMPYQPNVSFVIGMTARLSRIKDHESLIRAMSIVAQSIPEARLELAGDGELRESLQALVTELGLTDRVRFLGDVSDVYATMSHWDVFAYATTDQEGLGNALAEAMTLGLPCVVTDVGPMKEFQSTENDAILLVPKSSANALASAIIDLVKDQDQRIRLSNGAMRRAEQAFSLKSFTKHYAQLLGVEHEPETASRRLSGGVEERKSSGLLPRE